MPGVRLPAELHLHVLQDAGYFRADLLHHPGAFYAFVSLVLYAWGSPLTLLLACAQEIDFLNAGGNEVETSASTGVAFCSSLFPDSSAGYKCNNAFDQALGTRKGGGLDFWHSANPSDLTKEYIGWQFNTPTTIAGYEITSDGRYTPGANTPGSWVLEASNDGSTWQTIDSVSGHSWSEVEEKERRMLLPTDACA